MSSQKHSFQAEVAQLLHLVTHSLYSNKEIFLRELVSNASDACDKLRFEALADSKLYGDEPNLEIKITFDKQAHTLTVTDTGVGMSEAEAIEHLGTIAKSGTREFMNKLSGEQKADAQLIGQFGVGFYSGFIVADKITVESRRAGLAADAGVRWSSTGTGDFEVQTIERLVRGTSVCLHLREDCVEFADGWRIRELVGKYSDHIAIPIKMEGQKWQEGKAEGESGQMVNTGEWETINQATALWTRPKKDITKEQYTQFYEQSSHDWQPPLAWTHNRVEGSTEYTQLLFIPSHAPTDMWDRDHKTGVKLYVRRVFIMDDAEHLLPRYLRFIKGVVDSADLPLNVSRELLQDSRDVRAIREGNTRRVLSLLEELSKADQEKVDPNVVDVKSTDDPSETEPELREKFSTFWREFGAVLKEGLGEDPANRERIAKILRFSSTSSDAPTVSLSQYKSRMKEGQKAIYYITGDSLVAARNSPQLEIFRKKGIEVLLMTDHVDEWAMAHLSDFDGTALKSVAKGEVDLGDLQDEEEKKAADAVAEQVKPLLEKLKTTLGARVDDVRFTTRLVDSPACLVVKDGAISPQMARLLKQAGQPVPEVKPVLEINPDHALIKKLQDSPAFDDLAMIVLDQALLADGALPEDPAAYVRRVNALLV